MEVVVFLWQPSHVAGGEEEPVNEWADKMAGEAVDDGEEERSEVVGGWSYATFEVAGVSRGIRQWAVCAARRLAVLHVVARVTRTQLRRSEDLVLGLMGGRGVYSVSV